ncbi:MAG TPA: M56 family metallopeptidase [Vicinamibacterales bacterium]|nr:M56 family metallopeptidase [Vicinamibacterales bacterium]
MTSWVPASVANHVWQSTLFIALVWLVTLALRRHDARVRYWLWAAASVKFFLPFSWLIGLGTLVEWRTAPTIAQPAATFVMQEILAPPLLSDAVPQVSQDTRDTNIGLWIVLGVWLAGTTVVFFRWGRAWRPLRSALRQATPLRIGPTFAEATAGGPDSDAGGLTVMSSPSAFEPGVVGIVRPVLLFPEGLVDRLTPVQLDAILAHERAHVRAHDNLLAMVHMAVEAIFWFHPLVWWIERRMIDERERACDEDVVRAGKRPADYAEAILAVCRWSHESPVMCVSGVSGSNLRARIETIMANRLGRRLQMTGQLLLAAAALIVIAGPVGIGLLDAAPQEQASERFEVATIRPNTGPAVGGPIGGGIGFRPGRFSAENITLRQLLTYAYELQAYEIFGGPGWVTSDRFDIAATMQPRTGSGTLDNASRNRALVRALLVDRFNLVVHEERRELPVYSLVMAKPDRRLGARLRRFEGECGDPSKLGPPPDATFGLPTPSKGLQWCMAFTGTGRLSAQGTTLTDLATILARFPSVRRRVIDRTGLAGRFDFDLEWTPLVTGPPTPGATNDRPSDGGAPIFTALQEQLGLKLESTRETISVLVIDSVNQPSPN